MDRSITRLMVAAGMLLNAMPAIAQQLRGIVVDSATGHPLYRATVYLWNDSATLVESAQTGRSGGFVLKAAKGTFHIAVVPRGFVGRKVGAVSIGSHDSSVAFAIGATPVQRDRIYDWFEVERQPRPVSRRPPLECPFELRSPGLRARVLAAYVIDSTGTVDSESFHFLELPHPAYSREILLVVPRWRYRPAMVGNTPVSTRQLAPFTFEVTR